MNESSDNASELYYKYCQNASKFEVLDYIFSRDDIDVFIISLKTTNQIIIKILFLFYSILYFSVQYCKKYNYAIPSNFYLIGLGSKIFKTLGEEDTLTLLAKWFIKDFIKPEDLLSFKIQFMDSLFIDDPNYTLKAVLMSSDSIFSEQVVSHYGFDNEPHNNLIPTTEVNDVRKRVIDNYMTYLSHYSRNDLSSIIKKTLNIDSSVYAYAKEVAEMSFMAVFERFLDTHFHLFEPLFFWPQALFYSCNNLLEDTQRNGENHDKTTIPAKYDIFISYRRRDNNGQMTGRDLARSIYKELQLQLRQKKGFSQYKIFFDYSECTDGEFENKILNAVKSSKYFLLLLTKDALANCYMESDWVRREIETALSSGCKIIPLNPDNSFDTCPNSCPSHIKAITKYQFADIQMGSLFEKSIEYLIENRFN